MARNIVIGNQAKRDGGGVSLQGHSSLIATRDHVAESHADEDGGGYANDSSLSPTEIEVNNNQPIKNGGGGYAYGKGIPCTLEVRKSSKFHHNHAGWGGGIASDCKKLRISLFTFRANQAQRCGGLHATFGRVSIVSDNRLESNRASGTGAGMIADYAERGSVTENHFVLNQAGEGTGMTCESCKIPPAPVWGNEFRQNRVGGGKSAKGGDFFLDICRLGITLADVASNNTGRMPDVRHT
jgi:hypothetical protein